MEKQGWIAKAACTEIRVALPERMRMSYALADARTKFRMASENPAKIDQVKAILDSHPGVPALVIGMYLDQLGADARPLGLPVITGATPQKVRDRLYAEFKAGKIRILAVSKVANFAVDLPEASLAIQVSGTFGSRQEEAQRLGRVLRPKEMDNQAYFYSLVSRDTVEQEFAMKRQLFLCEQGYAYAIRIAETPAMAGAVPCRLGRPRARGRLPARDCSDRMKLFPADWLGFLDELAAWGELSIPARRTFLDAVTPGLSLAPARGEPSISKCPAPPDSTKPGHRGAPRSTARRARGQWRAPG